MVAASENEARSDVALDSDGFIHVVPRGKQTAISVKEMGETINHLVDKLHAQDKKILMLVDLRNIGATDSTSEGRLESRKLLADSQVEAMAIVGDSQLLSIVMYMAHVARMRTKMKYFKNMRKARSWLKGIHKPTHRSSKIGLVSGLALIAIGLSALLGWQLSNAYLRGWFPSLRPMNPMAAVGIMIVGWGFISYWQRAFKRLRIGGVVTVLLGVVSLLPFHTNYILYGGRVTAEGPHTHVAVSAAICFICMGIVALIAGRQQRWVPILEYTAAFIMGALSLLNIFGQLYAHDFIYSLSDNFVMAFNLAVAFGITTTGLALLTQYKRGGNVLSNVTRMGWLSVIALLLLQVATYGAWSQAIDRNKNEAQQMFLNQAENVNASVSGRVQAYIDALHGFRGLYEASDSVTQGDFQTYYNSLDLATNYPGLRTMAFIAAVHTKDLAAFTKQQRADTSLHPTGNPNFTVQKQTNQDLHFIATYTSDTNSTTALGLDLTSIPGRDTIYGTALRSGQPYTSGTVTFPGNNGKDPQQGFFITIPVKNSMGQPVGLVNANFNYNDFFPALFSQTRTTQNFGIIMTDDTNKPIYNSAKVTSTDTISKTYAIPIANGVWNLKIEAARTFGISEGQARLPSAILFAGQLFACMLAGLFLLQTRARRQALVLVDDVTADLQRERKVITELNLKDEAILSGLGEGLIALDHRGIVTRINPATERILGRGPEEMIGKHFSKAWAAADMNHKSIPPEKRPIALALTKHKVITDKMYYTRKNGEEFPIEFTVAPVVINNKVIGVIEVFRDITHDFELDKAKGEFVSLASHQLRTPLSAINWYAEMLLNGDAGELTKDQKEYLREIFEGNQRMIELVNSLLDVSRLELGRMANEPAPTSIVDLIDDIEKELTTSIMSKKLDFKKTIQPKLPVVVGDPKQLRMVVQNLMSNATKYTPDKGTVRVTLRRATAHDLETAKLKTEKACIYFSVKDSGYGIPAAQQPHIFEKLFRADNVRKLDVEGTGLGLYIVKQVVETMGGRVWFESVESLGATFYVVLPFKTSGTKHQGATS